MAEKKEENIEQTDYSTWNIFQKLTKARVLVADRMGKKSGVNTYAGYNYFTLDDIIPPMRTVFDQLGLCGVEGKEQAQIDPATGIQLKPPVYTLKIYNNHNLNDKPIIFTFDEASAGTKGQLPIQAKGSEKTYSRRYLYLDALEITEGDATEVNTGNPDDTAQPVEPEIQAPRMATAAQLKILKKNITDINAFFAWAGIKDWSELTAQRASEAIARKRFVEDTNVPVNN